VPTTATVDVNSVVELVASPDLEGAVTTETTRPERKNNTRRGPNRRRPRNPNYKKLEVDGEAQASNGDESPSTETSEHEPRPTPVRSYNSEFAERIEKIERAEPVSEPKPVEHIAPVVEFTQPVEVHKPESDSES
jgi:ribonuclease E